VANRDVNLIIDDGANEVFSQLPGTAPGGERHASPTTARFMGRLCDASRRTGGVTIPLPEALYVERHRIRTAPTHRQAGDNFTAPQYLVEEWIE
jgi:hypothetical protein